MKDDLEDIDLQDKDYLDPLLRESVFVHSNKRWLILLLYSIVAFTNQWLWYSLAAVVDELMLYYNTVHLEVQWLQFLYYIMFAVLAVPSAFLCNIVGLKLTIVIIAVCNAVSASFRYAGIGENDVHFVVVGQGIDGIGTLFCLMVPAKLAASWFPASERGIATAMAVASRMAGTVVAYPISIQLIADSYDAAAIRRGLNIIYLSQVACTLVTFGLVLALTEEKPPSPPSRSEMERSAQNCKYGEMTFFTDLKIVSNNYNYLLYCLAYSIYYGAAGTIVTLSYQLVAINHPEITESAVDNVSVICEVVAVLGILLIGFIQDRYKKYNKVAVGNMIAVTSFFIFYASTLSYPVSFNLNAIAFAMYDLFASSFVAFGLELVANMTYPVSEFTSCAPLLASGYGISFIFTITCYSMIKKGGLVFVIILVLLAYISTVAIVTKAEVHMVRHEIDTRLSDEDKSFIEDKN